MVKMVHVAVKKRISSDAGEFFLCKTKNGGTGSTGASNIGEILTGDRHESTR